ncbi:MAG: uroporphyrinogen decarboxylase family protein [Pirellulaceae bacterium]
MTNRERLLAIMAGQTPDRIPWIPRLSIWYTARQRAGTLPTPYRDMSLAEIERDLRVGTPARDGFVYRTEMKNVEVQQHWLNDLEQRTEYRTPVGTVTTLFRGSETLRQKGIQDLEVEFMLKRREDYATVQYILEQTDVIPTYGEYERYETEVGDDGYPMVHCGDCPFHHWMRAWVGYENAYFHLQDFPNEVEQLLAVMTQRDKEIVWKTIADSPAKLILHGVHYSSQMTPPDLFQRYITPYYQEMSALLRSRSQTLTLHGDNDTRHILQHIEQAGFGMVECFATDPLVETTLAEARQAWGDRVIIWGGVPSVILEDPYTDEQFEAYMQDLFRTIAPGNAFILGVADNVMPEAKIERIRRITEMVERHGTYPVSV